LPGLPPYRGPGRPTELTRELLENICAALADGASQKEAALASYINPDTFYEWRSRGEEDTAAQRPTLYAEFSDRVPAERARGKLALRKYVRRAIRTALPEGRKKVDARVASVAIQAGKLALQAINSQESGRRGAQKRWGTGQPEEPSAAPKEAPPVDLDRLEPGERAQLRELLRKARGQGPTQ
jgi:hypothetical protein